MKQKIINYIRAGYPGLYLVSHEEQRVALEMTRIAQELKYNLVFWSVVDGLVDTQKGTNNSANDPLEALIAIKDLKEKTLILLRDFHLFLQDPNPILIRQLKDVLQMAKTKSKTLIILGCRMVLPPELERELTVIEFALPGKEELGAVLGGIMESANIKSMENEQREITFLYVSLQMLLDLEKEVITFATMLGFQFTPEVGVHQLRAIEINPYAYELAQVTVQIGYLQWRRDNGFDNDRSPVLQNLDGFLNEDALLVPHYHSKAKTLKEAQAGEHTEDDSLKFYTEREWPECDVLVGNPPFLGDKLMRGELGDRYVEELRKTYGNRIPGQSDLCCYWFEKARDLIEQGKCKRAGLLATQGIRGGANREVLKRIKQSGDIFFAESDRKWILGGAMVHVSMVGFDSGDEKMRLLNGAEVASIHSNLASLADTTKARPLSSNLDIAFIGTTKGGNFDITEGEAIPLLNQAGNPNGKPTSDVLKPILNGQDVLRRGEQRWLIDNGEMPVEEAARYEGPHRLVVDRVKPSRDVNRDKWLRENWWKLQRVRPEMRAALARFSRFIALPRVAKHRVCVWFRWPVVTDDQTVVFARDGDGFFGVLQSHFHQVWAFAQGTQLRERDSGFRYRPTTCFETFPLPRPAPTQEAAIAAAAKELNELRERWLNPPEWTVERILEFPGSADGPWSRYVVNPDKNGIGTVRYPRLEPRDADCAAKLKKRTLTNLYNERPAWLDLAHKKLDAAVSAAYGWPAELTDEQILERLLALNLERAAEEAKAQESPKRKSAQRDKAEHELI